MKEEVPDVHSVVVTVTPSEEETHPEPAHSEEPVQAPTPVERRSTSREASEPVAATETDVRSLGH